MVRIHSASFAYNYEQNLEFSDKLLQSLKLFKLYTCTIKLIENEWNIWKIFVDIIKTFEHLLQSIIIENYILKGHLTMPKVKMKKKQQTRSRGVMKDYVMTYS